MITAAILNLIKGVVTGFLALLPHLTPPAWLTALGGYVTTIESGLAGTTGWVPWTELSLAVALAIAAVGVSVAIRGIRIAMSFLTLGGGS